MIGYFTPNGGTDRRTHYVTERKHRGWGAELAVHLPVLIRWKPPRAIWHLPWGTRDPQSMEFDGLVWARMASTATARELHYLTREDEFVGAFLSLAEAIPDTQLDFYLGSPEHSEIFTRAWNVGNLTGVDQRIESSIRPILKIRDRGAKVGLWIDMACARDKDSLTAYTHDRLTRVYGIETGIETRPYKVAEWANRQDVPCITNGPFWHHLENDPVAIPAKELKGPQWLIYEQSQTKQAVADLASGLHIAFIGEWHEGNTNDPDRGSGGIDHG